MPNAALRFRPAGARRRKSGRPTRRAPQQQGGQAAQEFRSRIQQELKPSDAQKAQLEEIYNESRQKFARVRDMKGGASGDAARRKEAERIRSETNARIGEILTPEQRPAWERLLAEAGTRGPSAAGRVYVLENGEPKPLDVRLGLSDGMSTEVSQRPQGRRGSHRRHGRRARCAPAAGGGLPRARFF